MKKLKYIIITLQALIIICLTAFGIYISIISKNYSSDINSEFLKNIYKLAETVISLDKSQGILWIFLNNFKVNAMQSILSFATLGISGIFSLVKDCFIYGFAFGHCKNIFVLFEFITSAVSVIISTHLSFEMYSKRRKFLDCIYDLSKIIILSCIPLIIGAIIESNLVYK